MKTKDLETKIRQAKLQLGDDFGDKKMMEEAIFKAGERKVVDWVEEHTHKMNTNMSGISLDGKDWQEFLRSEGIE